LQRFRVDNGPECQILTLANPLTVCQKYHFASGATKHKTHKLLFLRIYIQWHESCIYTNIDTTKTGVSVMGSFSRLRYVIAANVNSLLEKAEDPEKLLKALIRDMEDAAEDARLASADLLAEQTHLNRMKDRFEREISNWNERAQKSVEAGKDDLARAALKAKAETEQALKSANDEAESLDARMVQLEFDVATLKGKLVEAKSKLKDISSRKAGNSKGARGPAEQSLSPGERKVRRAMGRFDRLQSQVERLEARVDSYEFGGDAGNAWQSLETPADPLVEAELESLKKRMAPTENIKEIPAPVLAENSHGSSVDNSVKQVNP
jgi:phage shock protein A